MQLKDFSNGFDVLCNSYYSNAAFGVDHDGAAPAFNEYEKSVFLNKAQEEIVLGLYSGRNLQGEGFEQTEELRRYLSSLVEEEELEPVSASNNRPKGIDKDKSKFFSLPSDLWFITYESVDISDSTCAGHSTQDVYPVTQDEYHKIKRNPFRGANFRRALRLDLGNNKVEIVSKYTVNKYYLRYLKKLSPIVLTELDSDVEIEGKSTPQECLLPDILHQRILARAVLLALQSKGYLRNNENK